MAGRELHLVLTFERLGPSIHLVLAATLAGIDHERSDIGLGRVDLRVETSDVVAQGLPDLSQFSVSPRAFGLQHALTQLVVHLLGTGLDGGCRLRAC